MKSRLKPQNVLSFPSVNPEEQELAVVLALLCPKHKKIAISCTTEAKNKRFLWLPFVSGNLNETQDFVDLIERGIEVIFSAKVDSNADNSPSLGSTEIQIRSEGPAVERVVQLIIIDDSVKCCQNKDRIQWMSAKEIKAEIDKGINGCLWGPEVLRVFHLAVKHFNQISEKREDLELDSDYYSGYYLHEKSDRYSVKTPFSKEDNQLLSEVNITGEQIQILQTLFYTHCFPSIGMSGQSLFEFLANLGINWDKEEKENLFKAFNTSNTGFIGFDELVVGLAAMEPLTDLKPLVSRNRFVFNNFCDRKDKLLKTSSVRKMLTKVNTKDTEMEKKLNELMSDSQNGITFEKFNTKVVSNVFNSLCRSPNNVFSALKTDPEDAYDSLFKDIVTEMVTTSADKDIPRVEHKVNPISYELSKDGITSSGLKFNEFEDKSLEEKEKKAMDPKSVANVFIQEIIRFSKSGAKGTVDKPKGLMESDPQRLEQMLKKHVVHLKADPDLEVDGITSSGLKFNEFEDKSLEEKERKARDPKSVANVFIQEIIKFSKTGAKGTVDQPKGLMESDPQRLEQMLKSLCEEVTKLLKSESHCLSITSPVVVVGDIHGNIEDLLTIENTLSISRLIPTSKLIPTSMYLYLGDYVDRGKWSVECAIYLLSLKVLSPQNIHLLRGNHEVRELQEFFTFKEECTAKYGPQNRVYHLLNDVFDCLSVSAVVDDTIFCCHGGIPSSVHTIREIQAIPKPLRDPSAVECLPAHELLWNDPSTQEYFDQNDLCDQ
ncbi:unnamed protein product [Medioppia subpectinata]|uniref:Serine/threonine-protein phosphatase n=1 Tax=Medioppia subpectinata TaxID=1979941 RepID=A0A7R9L1I3_9ACAR|nr:unnamed protein product [Medioppia subpectinata]CAG2112606.1 unnamed protein product [Medioppia subpectinata]